MAKENIRAFQERLRKDKELQARLDKAVEGMTDKEEELSKVIALAEEVGLPFTAQEYLFADKKISDEELDNVAGGAVIFEQTPVDSIYKAMGIEKIEWNIFSTDMYTIKGKKYTYDEAFALFQKMCDQGAFRHIRYPGGGVIRRDTWSGDGRDMDPGRMSAAFACGEITGGEDF